MAILIDIEGIDGSGKGTQAGRLHERLQTHGLRSALISFPRYQHTRFGALVGRFLNGEFGTLDDVHPQLAALLYAGDRCESRNELAALIDSHDAVVLDRYVASNVAHQCAKLTGQARMDLMDFVEWLEFTQNALPEPDLVLLLDVPVRTAQMLIARKQRRDYTERAADIQEADAAYLQSVSDVYQELVRRDSSRWHVVPGTVDGRVRSIDEVAASIWDLVVPRLSDRTEAGA